jgi:hypothetical protein
VLSVLSSSRFILKKAAVAAGYESKLSTDPVFFIFKAMTQMEPLKE